MFFDSMAAGASLDRSRSPEGAYVGKDARAHEAELRVLAVPTLEWRPGVLDVAMEHHVPPIGRPTGHAHLAPHTRCPSDKLETAFGSAAGVGDAIRQEPGRPLLAGTGGQHAVFLGRKIDRGNLCDATLSGDAGDLPGLGKLRLVKDQLLAVGRPGRTAGEALRLCDAPEPRPVGVGSGRSRSSAVEQNSLIGFCESRSDVNANHWPSGDHAGRKSPA